MARFSQDDKIWSGNPNGLFSVKSAYHLEFAHKQSLLMQDSSSSNGSEWITSFWKSLWRLNVPPKIKMFAWRVCHEILPTKRNLLKRNVSCNATCPFCLINEETVAHILWGCMRIKDVWRGLFGDKWKQAKVMIHNGASSLLIASDLIDLECLGANVFWTTAWMIWFSRNDFIMRGKVPDFSSIQAKVLAWLDEWNAAKDSLSNRLLPRPQISSPNVWVPLASQVFKINFDGAIFPNLLLAGIGVVVRNSTGQVMAAMTQKISGISNSDHIETIAAACALDIARDIGYRNVILEGDSLHVI